MEFITTGNRIAVENFDIGKIYTITWETGNYKSLACTGKGTDFVMFQDQEPDLLFCLTMDSAISVSSIDEGGGGSGTNNYNELENKPSINGFVLVGNKTGAELGLASQSDLEDYATNASVVAGLATKQDALSSSQLAAVNSGITSALVTQIGTNTSAIAGKQDALSSSQLQAVNSGITSALVTQIGTNTSAIAGKQDALSSSQLSAVNSGITSSLVTQIGTNENNISKALTLEKGISIKSGADLNTYTTIGVYCAEDINIARSLTNSPVSTSTGSPFRLEVMKNNTSSRLIQKIYEPAMDNTTFNVYIRAYTMNGWSSWYKVGLTAV